MFKKKIIDPSYWQLAQNYDGSNFQFNYKLNLSNHQLKQLSDFNKKALKFIYKKYFPFRRLFLRFLKAKILIQSLGCFNCVVEQNIVIDNKYIFSATYYLPSNQIKITKDKHLINLK